MDLGFQYDRTALKGVKAGKSLLHGRCDLSGGDRSTLGRKEFFRLIFVNLHGNNRLSI
jgi:hypothetical protein